MIYIIEFDFHKNRKQDFSLLSLFMDMFPQIKYHIRLNTTKINYYNN